MKGMDKQAGAAIWFLNRASVRQPNFHFSSEYRETKPDIVLIQVARHADIERAVSWMSACDDFPSTLNSKGSVTLDRAHMSVPGIRYFANEAIDISLPEQVYREKMDQFISLVPFVDIIRDFNS